MALEESPFTFSEIESYRGQFDSAHPVASLLAEANTERQRLFDDTYRLLSELPYNHVQKGNYVELQAYHQLWRESDNDGTAERTVFISRRRNGEATDIAWHIYINDVTLSEKSRHIKYDEFVLPVGKGILERQVSDTFIGLDQVSPEELGMGALLWVSLGKRCLLYKGQDYSPLEVPQTWNITEAQEIYEVTDNLAWLVEVLSELKSCASSFEPNVTGDWR